MNFNKSDPDLEKAARILAASDGDWSMVYERFPKFSAPIQAFRDDSSKRRKGEASGPRSDEATLGNQLLSSIAVRAKKYAYTNGNGAKPKAARKRRVVEATAAPAAAPQMPLFEIPTGSNDLVETLSDKLAEQIVAKAIEKALKKLGAV